MRLVPLSSYRRRVNNQLYRLPTWVHPGPSGCPLIPMQSKTTPYACISGTDKTMSLTGADVARPWSYHDGNSSDRTVLSLQLLRGWSLYSTPDLVHSQYSESQNVLCTEVRIHSLPPRA